MKHFFKFMLLVILVGGASFGLSLWIAQKKQTAEPNPLLQRFTGTAEYRGSGTAAQKITSEEASFPHLTKNGSEIRYYHARSGQLKSITLGVAKPKAATLATIKPGASTVIWSPDGSEIVAQYGRDLLYTNLTENKTKKLDANISRPVFSSTSDRVAYLYFNQKDESGTINIADSSFSTFKNVLKTRLQNWEIQWTDERRLSLLASPGGVRQPSLFVLDTEKGTLDLIVDAKQNIEARWSPDAMKLLYSRKGSSGRPELFLYDTTTRISTALKTPGSASKCAWSDDGLVAYCAIPEGSDDSFRSLTMARLPGRQAGRSQGFETLFTPADSGFVDAREMMYSRTQNALIFKNFKDGRLYSLPLAQ